MNALSTMLLISDAFVELCDEMPLRKVSISDIVELTGKNRKTFYYHFENKDRLIIWIFRYDMGQCLKQHFSESVLLYDDDPEDPTSRFPYYITQKSGVRSLDHAEFFQCFAEVLEGRRNFYRQALVDNGCICVAEGANMPSTPDAIRIFQQHKLLFAPGKAVNAGGVATSGLEMTQNSQKLNWTAEEVDAKLHQIMSSIHHACVEYGTEKDGYLNYMKGANIAGFMKVAKSMVEQGVI